MRHPRPLSARDAFTAATAAQVAVDVAEAADA